MDVLAGAGVYLTDAHAPSSVCTPTRYRRGLGKKTMKGEATLLQLESWAIKQGEPPRISGRQEQLENTLNQYIFESN